MILGSHGEQGMEIRQVAGIGQARQAEPKKAYVPVLNGLPSRHEAFRCEDKKDTMAIGC